MAPLTTENSIPPQVKCRGGLLSHFHYLYTRMKMRRSGRHKKIVAIQQDVSFVAYL